MKGVGFIHAETWMRDVLRIDLGPWALSTATSVSAAGNVIAFGAIDRSSSPASSACVLLVPEPGLALEALGALGTLGVLRSKRRRKD